MYYNDPYYQYGNPYGNYQYEWDRKAPQNYPEDSNYIQHYNSEVRQQPARGQASWTDGGQVTRCGIPWSHNQFMTVAVGVNAPYRCGDILIIRNLTSPGQREITVTVVDQVTNYPANKINLHRNAFEALGANLNEGVINVEIIPATNQVPQPSPNQGPQPSVNDNGWGRLLSGVIQSAYPSSQVVNYQPIGKTEVSPTQTRETYEFTLQGLQGQLKIRGNVVYNSSTNQLVSVDLKEA
ncbi:DUF3889 domain-containing protein [Evansella sp. AB-P1]|uniref:DUF3889 domain-containing protein n=1 Tax=Evansella sp. AB-P1 TaxID=3037653 RepID=UPI00241ED6C0|nr:DUF3889 domain-containing protein [Evansella sp. AB-P1]MDG5788362.1 DUF3889 domain-containing protein [Evansella sp. AB-P1]